MSTKQIVLNPVVDMINRHLGTRHTADDYVIRLMDDPLKWDPNVGGEFAGEKRCIYDFITKKDIGGVRVRVITKPDKTQSIGDMRLDRYVVSPEDDMLGSRVQYTATYRVLAKAIGMSYDNDHCPDISQLLLEGCTVIVTESGYLIQTEVGEYITSEQSTCTG